VGHGYGDGIANGPDGALWFTEGGGNAIGRITTSGTTTQFPLPSPSSNPAFITAGSDGALWFTEYSANRIGRITTAGTITEYPLAGYVTGEPGGIVGGPDGALWYTEEGTTTDGPAYIGRITTQGAITTYKVPDLYANLTNIVVGSDGAMWFGEVVFGGPGYPQRIGRITTQGVFSSFATSDTGGSDQVAAGTDGAIWFGEQTTLGRITVNGSYSSTQIQHSPGQPIVFGSNQTIWIPSYYEMVGWTFAGTAKYYNADGWVEAGDGGAGIQMVVGPDGAFWYCDGSGYVVRFAPPSQPLTRLIRRKP
jgi:virginiamycin B lyase